MIIGNGLIADIFKQHDVENVVFFASGVSNSLETNPANFQRERELLLNTIKENKGFLFIYFSTCSIYDSSKTESPYVLHKLEMEHIISSSVDRYLILRVSNVVGKGGNPNLLLNYLHRSIEANRILTIHTQATRNLIDSDDVRNITLQLIHNNVRNSIVNVAYLHEFNIVEIVECFEDLLQKTAKKQFFDSGNHYHIHLKKTKEYFHQRSKTNKTEYLYKIVKKYYL